MMGTTPVQSQNNKKASHAVACLHLLALMPLRSQAPINVEVGGYEVAHKLFFLRA